MSKKYENAEVVFSEKGRQLDVLLTQTKQNEEKIIVLDKELERLYGMLPYLRTEIKIKQVETEIEKLETQKENLKRENKRIERKMDDLSHKSIAETELLLRGKWPRNKN